MGPTLVPVSPYSVATNSMYHSSVPLRRRIWWRPPAGSRTFHGRAYQVVTPVFASLASKTFQRRRLISRTILDRSIPGDLARHICLGFAGSALEERWTFYGDGGETIVPIVSRFSTNSGEARRQAALTGLDIVMHVEELLADDVATGRLVHILPEWRSERPLHILHAPDRRITPKVRSFLDFAAARFGPA